MEIKLKVKLGDTEFEYEGPEEFVGETLSDVLESLVKVEADAASSVGASSPSESSFDQASDNFNSPLQMATNSIAAKLDVKSGPDLVIASCAHLDLALGKSTFSRKDILGDMKSAQNYFKDSYRKNLSHSLSSLLKDDKLVQRSEDQYALTAEQRSKLEATLGNS